MNARIVPVYHIMQTLRGYLGLFYELRPFKSASPQNQSPIQKGHTVVDGI